MKISVFYSHLVQAVLNEEIKNTDEAFSLLVPKGLKAVDLASAYFNENTTEHYISLAKNNGITYSSVFDYLENFLYKDESYIKDVYEQSRIRIAKTAEIGAPCFMPVPVLRGLPEDEADLRLRKKVIYEYFAEVAKICKENGIIPVVENFSSHGCPFSTIKDFEYILGNMPDIKFVLDTGNFWYVDENLMEATKKFADKTVHVHIKDMAVGDEYALQHNGKHGESCAIGSGILPIKEAIEHLKTVQYSGALVIEINNSVDILNKVNKSVDYLNSIL